MIKPTINVRVRINEQLNSLTMPIPESDGKPYWCLIIQGIFVLYSRDLLTKRESKKVADRLYSKLKKMGLSSKEISDTIVKFLEEGRGDGSDPSSDSAASTPSKP